MGEEPFTLSLIGVASAELTTTLSNNVLILGNANAEPDLVYEAVFTIDTNLSLSLDVLNEKYTNLNIILNQTLDNNKTVVTIKAYMPRELPAINIANEISSINVAQLNFSNEQGFVIVDLNMQRKNNLILDRINIISEVSKQSRAISDGRKIDFLSPGDYASLELRIRNTFSSISNTNIDNVKIEIYDVQDALRIDEEETLGRIWPNDYDEETISFRLYENVDEGLYDVIIKVSGTDAYNALHGQIVQFSIDIKRKRDDVAIVLLSLTPDSITNCNEQSVRLNADIKNVGRNNQRNIILSVQGSSLNYNNQIPQISLDQKDSITRGFTLIIPKDFPAGGHTFVVSVYNDRNVVTDERSITLFVRPCVTSSQTSEQQQPSSSIPLTSTQLTTTAPIISDHTSAQAVAGHVDITSSQKQKYEISTNILIALFIVLIILVLWLGIVAFRK
jgi:hypothetical protein